MTTKEKIAQILIARNPSLASQQTFIRIELARILKEIGVIQGERGLQGEKGDIGSIGPVGPRGEAGQSPDPTIVAREMLSLVPRPSDGATPVRGVDYMHMNDINMIAKKAAALLPKPAKEVPIPDVKGMVEEHLEAYKKNLPTNDSIVVQLLKHPLLRVLMHGGGGTGTTVTFTENEVVAGSGTAWTLAATPTSGSLKLYVNGQRLMLTTDYTIVGAAITTLQSWASGTILADYRI